MLSSSRELYTNSIDEERRMVKSSDGWLLLEIARAMDRCLCSGTVLVG